MYMLREAGDAALSTTGNGGYGSPLSRGRHKRCSKPGDDDLAGDNDLGMTALCSAARARLAQRTKRNHANFTATLPSPSSSIVTLSPALSHAVLTRLPVSTIS